MPTPLTTALLAFAAITLALSVPAGVVIAALAVAWQAYIQGTSV